MEPVTHALSGAVIACALPEKKRAWWFPVWAMLVAVSPDADVFFVHSPLQYIEYHRGITHSLAGGWALALIFALLLFLLNRMRSRPHAIVALPMENGSLIGAWGLAYLIVLHHIWLDCMNSYGTQIFLPFSDYRVRWNALFIVDPLLLLPLLLGLLFKRKSRPVMIALLLWTILYPLGALATRLSIENTLRTAHDVPDSTLQVTSTRPVSSRLLVSDNLPAPEQLGTGTWDGVSGLHLVPDAFTPFHWKLILSRETTWDVAGYTVLKNAPLKVISYAKPPRKLWKTLGEHDRTFRIYQRFALYPALDEVIRFSAAHPLDTTLAELLSVQPEDVPPDGLVGEDEYTFSDLRFGSTIPFVDTIQVKRDGKPLTFRIMARILPDGKLASVRFITTKGAGGDSGWNPPFPD